MNAWCEHLSLAPRLRAAWRIALWAVKFLLEARCYFSLHVWAAHLTPGVALTITPSLYIKWRDSQHYPFLLAPLFPHFPPFSPSSLFPPPFPPSPSRHPPSLTLPPSPHLLPFPLLSFLPSPQIQQNKTKQQFSFQRTERDGLFWNQMWAITSSNSMLQWGSTFRKLL